MPSTVEETGKLPQTPTDTHGTPQTPTNSHPRKGATDTHEKTLWTHTEETPQHTRSRGVIQQAYRGLMDYILDLKAYLSKSYPDYYVSGIYQGYARASIQ